jgi:hypothetical protein
MTALSDKLKALKAEQEVERGTLSPEYKRAIWHLLIARGGVLSDYDQTQWGKFLDFYGGVVNTSTGATKKCLDDIADIGIDWAMSTDPATDTEMMFTDTFNEPAQVGVLKGKLYLQDGTFTWWGCRVNTDFGDLIKILTLGITWDEALEEVLDRLAKAGEHNEWNFQYGCRV